MALAFSQSSIATSAMASSYWPDSDNTPFVSSGNPGGGAALSPATFNISSSLSSAANTHAAYNVSQSSQSSHGGYSTYGQQEEQMSYPSLSQTHHTQAQVQMHRPVSGIGVGERQPPVLRPHAQQAFVASLSAQNSGSASLSSPLSSGSSGSSSLTPSLTSSSLSTITSNPTSGLSPLSPNAHHPPMHTQIQQTPRDRVNVHSHEYSMSGSTHQVLPTSVGSIKSGYTTRMGTDLGVQTQMLYSFDSHEPSSFGHEYGHGRYHSQLQANAHSGPDYATVYSTSPPSIKTRPASASVYTHITSNAARPTSGQSLRSPSSDEFQNRARIRPRAAAYVKAEPDLEDPRQLERSPDLTGDSDEGGGARFVMEHPYPYAYATTSRNAKDRSISPSPPPYTEHGLDDDASNNDSSFLHPSKGDVSRKARHDLQLQQTSQPHTLTAPLRAVNATEEMRACMGVFRLNPFAQLNGVALKCGFIASSEEGTFTNRKGNNKKKGKGKKGKKRRGAGKKSRKHVESDDEDDMYAEMSEDVELDEGSDDNTPTWDGFPAGPLVEEPVLIEFQLYCDGMEIEDNGGDALRDANDRSVSPKDCEDESGDGRVMNDADATHCYQRSRTCSISANTPTTSSVSGRGAERNKGETRAMDSAQGSRYVGIVDYANNTEESKGRGPEYERKPEGRDTNNTQSHIRQPKGSSGSMFEYLQLDLGDADMEVEGWGSAEASPATPYSLSQSRTVGRHFDSFMQAQIATQRTDPIPTCVNSLATSSGSSSSVYPNSLPSIPQSSTATTANDVNGRTDSTRSRYIDSAGYMRFSDSTHIPPLSFGQSTPMSTSTEHGSNSGAGSSPSPFYGPTTLDAGIEAVNGSATLQQLRTQAALRAVSAHASQSQSQPMHGLYRGVPETASGNAQRSAGVGGGSGGAAGTSTGTVSFTPTPASLAAEMQAGSLGSGRLGMNPHQQSRMRASSLAYRSSHISQGQGQTGTVYDSYSQSQQMMSDSQQAGSSSTYSSSGCTYTDYLATAESDSGSGVFDHNLQAPERRWSDVSQRVQS